MESFAYLQGLRDNEKTLNNINTELKQLAYDVLTETETLKMNGIINAALSINLIEQSKFYKELKKQL